MQGLAAELRRDLILSLNTHRSQRPLSPTEVAEAIDAALKSGASFADLAGFLSFDSSSTLREIHRLLSLAPEIRPLVGWGRSRAPLTMTAASQIARLTDTGDQQAVVEAVLVHSLTSDETRQVVETNLRSARPISECAETVLRLRPRIERKHLLMGAVTSASAQDRLADLTQRRRDELLRQAVTECIGRFPAGWVGSLGPSRFTILGGGPLAETLKALPEGFEAGINRCLEAMIQQL